jgi:actin beta/gamma 1
VSAPAATCVFPSALAVLAASNGNTRLTGLVVESGNDVTTITPVSGGRVLPGLARDVAVGGRDVTQRVVAALLHMARSGGGRGAAAGAEEGCLTGGLDGTVGVSGSKPFAAMTAREQQAVARAVKKRQCVVSAEREPVRDQAGAGRGGRATRAVDDCATQTLFHTDRAAGSESAPAVPSADLSMEVFNVLLDCDERLWAPLLGNVLLAGGNMAFAGLSARLQKDLQDIAPDGMK